MIEQGSVVRLRDIPTSHDGRKLEIGDIGVVKYPPAYAAARVAFFRAGIETSVKLFRLEEMT